MDVVRSSLTAILVATAACSLVDTNDLTSPGADGGSGDAGNVADGGAGSDAAPSLDGAASADGADGGGPSYRDAVLADHPVVYWRFGEAPGVLKAADTSGNAYTATYGSGCTLGQPGAIARDTDTAVKIDGTNPAIGEGAGPDFSARQPYSVEAWIKVRAAGTTHGTVFIRPFVNASGFQDIGMYVSSVDGLVFERYVDNNVLAATTNLPALGQFAHVVGTFDGSALSLYVDGKIAATQVDTRTQVAKPVTWSVGMVSSNESLFDGVIDELAIYPTALTVARVQAHYAAGTAR